MRAQISKINNFFEDIEEFFETSFRTIIDIFKLIGPTFELFVEIFTVILDFILFLFDRLLPRFQDSLINLIDLSLIVLDITEDKIKAINYRYSSSPYFILYITNGNNLREALKQLQIDIINDKLKPKPQIPVVSILQERKTKVNLFNSS